MLIVWCPNQDTYSAAMGTLNDVGIKWKKPPSPRRVMVAVVGQEKWVLFPTDHYAAQRKKDGSPSVEDRFVDRLIMEHGMTVYRPKSDKQYHEGDGDGGIGVPTPALI